MRRGEKRLFLGILAILAVAFALLVAQWAGGANTPKVYRVSVLLDGAESDYWKNFRAGINQAAQEQNVDLRFVTRYDAETTQADALRREWESQADGVILIPTDGAALSTALEDAPSALAVGVMGPTLQSDRVSCYVSPDYDQMGRRLADAAAQVGGGCTLFLSPHAGEAAQQIAAGLESELSERGISCARNTASPENVINAPARGALVAVEPDMAEALAQAGGVAGRVCGVGSSSRLLHYLEEGTVSALVVQSDYDAGYLSLTSLVRKITQGATRDAVLESYTATGENMLQEPMINILFATY